LRHHLGLLVTIVFEIHMKKIYITSPDGITWTARSSGTLKNLNGVAYGNSIYVAVGYSGTILTSPDGITWTERDSGISNYLSGVTFSR